MHVNKLAVTVYSNNRHYSRDIIRMF